MKKIILLSLVIGVSYLVPVFGQSFETRSFRDGKRYIVKVDEDTLRDTPSWDPEREKAPLSLEHAIEIGRKNLKLFVPRADKNWDLEAIKLQRIGERESKWVYEISFYCFISNEVCKKLDDAGFTVYVKLDGTVVTPKIEPDNEPNNMKTGPPIKIAPPKKP